MKSTKDKLLMIHYGRRFVFQGHLLVGTYRFFIKKYILALVFLYSINSTIEFRFHTFVGECFSLTLMLHTVTYRTRRSTAYSLVASFSFKPVAIRCMHAQYSTVHVVVEPKNHTPSQLEVYILGTSSVLSLFSSVCYKSDSFHFF